MWLEFGVSLSRIFFAANLWIYSLDFNLRDVAFLYMCFYFGGATCLLCWPLWTSFGCIGGGCTIEQERGMI